MVQRQTRARVTMQQSRACRKHMRKCCNGSCNNGLTSVHVASRLGPAPRKVVHLAHHPAVLAPKARLYWRHRPACTMHAINNVCALPVGPIMMSMQSLCKIHAAAAGADDTFGSPVQKQHEDSCRSTWSWSSRCTGMCAGPAAQKAARVPLGAETKGCLARSQCRAWGRRPADARVPAARPLHAAGAWHPQLQEQGRRIAAWWIEQRQASGAAACWAA